MKTLLIKTLIVLAVVIAAFVVIVSFQPNDFRYTRSIAISAPPAVIFSQINDLHKFQDWSPWAKVDPNAKIAFSGPEAGVGSSFTWDGNNNVGTGRMTLTDSNPNDLVRFRLDFEKPFKGTNKAEFTIKPEGNQTKVTWSMYGENGFVAKAMGLILNCEKMVGKQFDQGLAALKTISESQAKQ